MIASLICFWRGHSWPVVGWGTHAVGDVVQCKRCPRRIDVRCERAGGPVTLPTYRTHWMPSPDGGPPFYAMLMPTPCTPRPSFNPSDQVRWALAYLRDRERGRGWDTYVKGDADG